MLTRARWTSWRGAESSAWSRGSLLIHPPGEFHALRGHGQLRAEPGRRELLLRRRRPRAPWARGPIAMGEAERALIGAHRGRGGARLLPRLWTTRTTTALERRPDAPLRRGAARRGVAWRSCSSACCAPDGAASPAGPPARCEPQSRSRSLFGACDAYLAERPLADPDAGPTSAATTSWAAAASSRSSAPRPAAASWSTSAAARSRPPRR